jgi:putative ABC transport system ATP-binding protein
LLELFGAVALADIPVAQLSSGERQRVALVAGVATLPRLLLIDEPTSQLNIEERDEVIDTISAIHDQLGITIIVVTHDPEVAARLERTVTIRDGRVGAEGRYGTQFAVVGSDGSLQLPPEVLDVLPPGSLVRVIRRPDGVDLLRADDQGGRDEQS